MKAKLATIATAIALVLVNPVARAQEEVVLDTQLGAAIDAGDVEAVTAIIDADPSLVKKIGAAGITALHLASEQTAIAKLLIERGANLDSPSMFSGPPLHRTIKAGNMELASFLLEKGANIDAKDADGITVMHCLAWVKNQAQAKKLYDMIVAKRPELLEDPGDLGYTPLWMCVDRINLPVTMLFLYEGADPNKRPAGPGSSAADSLKERLAKEPDLAAELKALATAMKVQ